MSAAITKQKSNQNTLNEPYFLWKLIYRMEKYCSSILYLMKLGHTKLAASEDVIPVTFGYTPIVYCINNHHEVCQQSAYTNRYTVDELQMRWGVPIESYGAEITNQCVRANISSQAIRYDSSLICCARSAPSLCALQLYICVTFGMAA